MKESISEKNTISPQRLISAESMPGTLALWEEVCQDRISRGIFIPRKAQIEMMLSETRLFPHQIPRVVIPLCEESFSRLEKELRRIVQDGAVPGIRTVMERTSDPLIGSIGVTPTKYGHIQRDEDIHAAVRSFKKVLENNRSITHVILMENPQSLLGEREQSEGVPIAMRMHLETDNFIDREASIFIEGITGVLDMRRFDVGHNLGIPEIFSGKCTIYDNTKFLFDWREASPKKLATSLPKEKDPVKNIFHHSLPLEERLDESKRFIKNLLITWCDSIHLMKRLRVLRDIGLSMVEIQARYFSTTGKWVYGVYGLRGPNDDSRLTVFQSSNPVRF